MLPCPVGMYSLGKAHSNCTGCPVGFECKISNAAPVACFGGLLIFYSIFSIIIYCELETRALFTKML